MNRRIAFVDDDERCINSMRLVLSDKQLQADWDLVFFTDPKLALEDLVKHGVTALVTDENMPAMSGHELIESARKAAPELVAVLLCGSPEESHSHDTIVMEKPCDPPQILQTIARALEERKEAG